MVYDLGLWVETEKGTQKNIKKPYATRKIH